MTRETFIAALGTGTDSVPTFLRDMTLGMDILGIRTTDVFGKEFDPRLSSESIIAFQKFTGQDAVIGSTHSASFIIEQFGGKMKYPEYGIPVPLTHPLVGMTDFSGLDVEPKGKMLSAFESYSLVRSALPDVAVVANVTGPFTKAGVLASMEYLSMLIVSENDVLQDLIDLCLDNTQMVVDRLCTDDSVDAGLIAAATDNPDLFGRDVYRRVSVPNTKRVSDMFHAHGRPVIYHPHGTFASEDVDILEDTIPADYDGFHFPENNDLRLISEHLGHSKCILGGTDIVPTLYNNDRETIISETRRIMDMFSENRFVFMASCSLHRGTPLDAIRTMMDAVRNH